MPAVLYLADRGSLTFDARRITVDVVCAGDSITGWNNFRRHERDWPFCSYPEFLQVSCEPIGLTVVDCGIAGEISPNGVGQVREYLGLFPNARFFVLGYGSNDLDKWPIVEETSPRVIENLASMVEAVRGDERAAVLLDVLNADESRLSSEEAEALHRTLSFHNDRLREYCRSHRVPLVENFGRLSAGQFDDPFHPNEQGARVIAQEVFRVLNEVRKTEGGGPASGSGP
jgi:lysophospholipase L1-like esterase